MNDGRGFRQEAPPLCAPVMGQRHRLALRHPPVAQTQSSFPSNVFPTLRHPERLHLTAASAQPDYVLREPPCQAPHIRQPPSQLFYQGTTGTGAGLHEPCSVILPSEEPWERRVGDARLQRQLKEVPSPQNSFPGSQIRQA